MAKVLITGGSGLIGQKVCKVLLEKGYEVSILSRSKRKNTVSQIPTYYWDIDSGEIDSEAINTCDYIIHLAGANIGGKRWTRRRKKLILDSRIKSAKLILHKLDKHNHSLKAFISASAIGYYGAQTSENIFIETDSSADDFLGNICCQWERSADMFSDLGVRVVKIRTGIVLSGRGGALTKFNIPAKLGLGSAIGNGKQYFPWIHINDLCNIYLNAIQNTNIKGTFNAVAPEQTTMNDFARKNAQYLKKAFWFPNIPSILISLMFGKMAVMLLNGSRISSERIRSAGYIFQFPDINGALEEIYG